MARRKVKNHTKWKVNKRPNGSKDIKQLSKLIISAVDAVPKDWNKRSQALGKLIDKIYGLKITIRKTDGNTYSTIANPSKVSINFNPYKVDSKKARSILKNNDLNISLKGVKFSGVTPKNNGGLLYLNINSLRKLNTKSMVRKVVVKIGDVWGGVLTSYKTNIGMKAINDLGSKGNSKSLVTTLVNNGILLKGQVKLFNDAFSNSIAEGQIYLAKSIVTNVINKQMLGINFISLYSKKSISLEVSKAKIVVLKVILAFAVINTILLLLQIIVLVATGHLIIAFITWLLYRIHKAIARWTYNKIKKFAPDDKLVKVVETTKRKFKEFFSSEPSKECWMEPLRTDNLGYLIKRDANKFSTAFGV